MITITKEQETRITETIAGMSSISRGIGNKENACSIAAINLALTGELTDQIPECMSVVVGRWIILVQDEMPAKIRNSLEWRTLLPLAAGTGRDAEKERLDIILDWMWEKVLPSVQEVADRGGFGSEWVEMLSQRSDAAASATAAKAARHAAARAAAEAAAQAAAYHGAYVTVGAAGAAAYHAAKAAAYADDAAHTAAKAARYAAGAATHGGNYWQTINPPALLRELINVGTDR